MHEQRAKYDAARTRGMSLRAAARRSLIEWIMPMKIEIELNDAQETRLLNVQDSDGGKFDAVVSHVFELGLRARENSIKASNARKLADEKAAKLDKFNTFVAQGMKIEDALMYAGLAIARPADASNVA
jgi:hypothetical protein